MWDCVSHVDPESIEAVRALGGLAAIAISHPHFYASNAVWSQAFGDCPVYIHAADAQWVQYPHAAVKLWEGETLEILPGLTLINTGGHFEGSQALHWAAGQGGRGALLSGDTITVVMDRRYVSFMYSYPNLIPLPAAKVEAIGAALAPFAFDSIYGAWWDRVIERDGSAVVRRSIDRYTRAVTGAGLPS